jgi:predicted phosphodiesterase
MKRLMAVGDTHGDEIDRNAARYALDFQKSFKPDCSIHLGDAWDFRWLRKSASKDEQDGRITDDINAGIEFISAYKPDVFCIGNHDQRVWDKADSTDGKMEALCQHIIEKCMASLKGCKVIGPYDKRNVFTLDNWKFGHGWQSGINATREHALRYGNIVTGHLHRLERIPGARFDAAVGICAGALCKIALDYNRSQLGTFAQGHGLMYGEKKRGRWVMQIQEIA